MKKLMFSALSVLMLSGCCINQYEAKGYSLGLDCFTPDVDKDKTCKQEESGKSCDETVNEINSAIENRIDNNLSDPTN